MYKYNIVDTFNGGEHQKVRTLEEAAKFIAEYNQGWKSYMGTNCINVVPIDSEWEWDGKEFNWSEYLPEKESEQLSELIDQAEMDLENEDMEE